MLQASSTGLQQAVGAFIATAESVDTVLWLLYVSLALAGLVVLLLAARMVVLRRSAELAIRQARGASLWQLAIAMAGGAALACVPAAAIAVGLAVLVIPGSRLGPGAGPAVTWWPAAAVLLVAVCAPAVVAVWRHRLPRRRAQRRRRARPATRLVAEATACLAAIAGILVFRQLGRLATMGLDEGHRARMVVLEVLPAVVAAAVAAWACAVALPRVVAPAIDLSAFTGSPAAVALTPDVAAVALPLAGLVVVTAVALAIEIRTGRRRGVTASLRAGG